MGDAGRSAAVVGDVADDESESEGESVISCAPSISLKSLEVVIRPWIFTWLVELLIREHWQRFGRLRLHFHH